MLLHFVFMATIVENIVMGVIVDKLCTEPGGNQFSWTATACEDKIPSCKDMYSFKPGVADDRAKLCYEKPAQKQFAIATCQKSCKYCCLKPEFSCEDNAASPLPCEHVTKALCNLKEMRDFLVKNCPSKCGFCKENGNEDGGNDCPADNVNCVNWVKNGFCDSTLYTLAQKKQHCGHACKLC